MDKSNTSNVKPITTLSESNFYREIIKKYQKGKSNSFTFTIMIFYKNKEHIFSQKINMSILLQFHLYNQNIVPSLIVKSIPATKGMFSWLNTEKIILPSIVKRKIAQSMNELTNIFLRILKIPRMYQIISGLLPSRHIPANRISAVSFLKSVFFRAENMTTESNRILKQLFLAVNAAFYHQATHTVSSISEIMNPQFLNYGNYMQIIYPQTLRVRINYKSVDTAGYSTFIEKEKTREYQSAIEHKSPAILSQNNLLFNRTSTLLSISTPFFNNTNWAAINKPLIKNYYYNFGPGAASFARRYAYKTGDEKGGGNLRFNNQKRIEQEIELIKKIVVETKESVMEKTTPALGEADIKRYLDINRISDQVYQNIERTIRMERERRGI